MSRSLITRFGVAVAVSAIALLGTGVPATADGSPALVTDINTQSAGSDPAPIIDVGGTAFVFACDGSGNLTLWRSDGTAEGPQRVTPATFGGCTGGFGDAVAFNGRLYFLTGDSLWSSDGTAAGTDVVVDSLFRPEYLTVVGSKLFFLNAPYELWVSDGTAGGTQKVKSIDVDGDQIVGAGDSLYFGHAGNLWTSDGTAAGTVMVKDLTSGKSWIRELTAVGSRVFFTANPSKVSTGALWVSNGTAAGTHTVKDIDPKRADAVSSLVAAGNRLFFVARDATHGFEVWKSDGTASGTRMLRDIRPGAAGSKPQNLIASGSRLYFAANDGAHGTQLWTSDGMKAGTLPLSSTAPWAHDSTYLPEHATLGGTFFFAGKSAAGIELWKSDGTKAGTGRVADINPTGDSTPTALAIVGGKLYFSATDGTAGRELWTSDGSATGTTMVADLNLATVGSSSGGLIRVGSNVFFSATDGVHGFELWKTDGSSSGTSMVKDILPGPRSGLWDTSEPDSYGSAMARIGSELYFVANDGVAGEQIWKSDGTATGTQRVSNVEYEVWREGVPQLTVLGSRLLFVASEAQGTSLWVTDGTAAGTQRLHKPGSANVYGTISEVLRVGGSAYFTTTTEQGRYPNITTHMYLWKTDGTLAGTRKVPYDFGVATPRGLATIGGTLYFERETHGHIAMWKSDGTAAGTVHVRNFDFPGNGGVGLLQNVGGRLYFTADRYDDAADFYAPQLWTSDGTSAGTTLLYEFAVQETPDNFTAMGNTMFFTADDNGNGTDLWSTDGTPAGTICVKERTELDPGWLRAIDGELYFAGGTSASGVEPYQSDGTAEGTLPIVNLNPNDDSWGSSMPGEFTKLGTNLLFTADDGSHGRELWVMPLP